MWKQVIFVFASMLLVAAVAMSWGVRRTELDAFDLMVTSSVPVAVDFEFTPDPSSLVAVPNVRIVGGNSLYEVTGTAKVFFSNLLDHPIKVMFPPRSTFSLSANQFMLNQSPPKFAEDSRVVEIASADAVAYDMTYRVSFFDKQQLDEFLHGGHGLIGFVFDAPQSEGVADDYLVGTVFPHYSVVGLRDKDDLLSKRARENRLAYLRHAWKTSLRTTQQTVAVERRNEPTSEATSTPAAH